MMNVAKQADITKVEEEPQIEGGFEGIKVIVLDDDNVDQERISRVLKSAGVDGEICRATTVQEFAEKVELNRYDFAFIDFNLADGSGLDALYLLKRQQSASAVLPIMVSGEVRADVAVQAMKDGCKDYLTKDDLSPEKLRASMTQALKKAVPTPADEEVLKAQVQIIMKTINDVSISDLRPRIAKMLRLIRQTRKIEDASARHASLQQLDQGCLELQKFCEDFSKEVAWRAQRMH